MNLAKGCNLCVDDRNLMGSVHGGKYSHIVIPAFEAFADMLAISLAGILVFYAHPELSHKSFAHYLPVIALTTVSAVFVFRFAGMYRVEASRYYLTSLGKIIQLCSILFLALIAVIFAFKVGEAYSRFWLFGWFLASALFIYVERGWISGYLKSSRQDGRLRKTIAIVGGEEQGSRMVKFLLGHHEPWTNVLAIFDDRVDRLAGVSDFPIVGNVEDLISHVRSRRIDEILVALPWQAERRTLGILRRLQELPVPVRLCPDLVGFNFPDSGYSSRGGIPILHVYEKPIDGWDYVIKSVEDKLLSLFALVLVLPVMSIVAILIKLDSEGPVFFRQKRYGFNNELIDVLKFRTMRVDDQDSNAEKLVTQNDPRVTRIGRLLRRTSLDELPQILNVLKGEMSMVGPRPHATKAKAAGRYYQDVVSEYAYRHKVKPGITGWAQIQGWRGETDTEEKIIKRVEHDLYYIDNWSVGLDLYILLKTIQTVVRTENAY